jgi:L-xylulokinase
MSDASSANLIDTVSGKPSETLLAHFGIPEMLDALPPLAQSLSIIGKVTGAAADETGLAVGTPVIGGMIDCAASAVGIGVVEPGQVCIVIGTWSINQVIVEQPSWSPDLFLTAPFVDPRYWLLLEGSATSAANLEWFVTHFGLEERLAAEKRGISPYDVCNEAVESVLPDDATVVYHPFLYGSSVQANASAGFFGLSGWHTRAHLLRAVYEGVVFGHLLHIDKLKRAGTEFASVRMGGGGARSAVWVQMFADMLQIPAEVPEGHETGTRGAALAAGVATGVYRDLPEAVQAAVRVTRVHEPNPHNAAIYHARYELYKSLIGSMQPQWNAL